MQTRKQKLNLILVLDRISHIDRLLESILFDERLRKAFYQIESTWRSTDKRLITDAISAVT